MRVAVRKLDGVESVEVSLERASADVHLRPENQVTLSQLRKIIKDNGFSPREATVTVVGTLVERGGKPALSLTGSGIVWLLTPAEGENTAYNDALQRIKTAPTAPVEVVGTVAVLSNANQPEELSVQSLKPASK